MPLARGFCALTLSLLIALTLLIAPAGASEYVGEAPPWALTAVVPDLNPGRDGEAAGGIYFLLADRQIDWEPGKTEYYSRYVYRVQSGEGLEEAAAINQVFDPTHETLRFHKITVTRGTQVIDLTQSTTFEVFRQEEDLAQGILDGHLTVHTNLPDIRVGDTIDYAYTLVRKPKIAALDFYYRFSTVWSVPIGHARTRITIHGSKPLHQRSISGVAMQRIAGDERSTTYEWSADDPEPIQIEEDAPDWYDPSIPIDASTMEDWSVLTAEMASHYDTSMALPPSFRQQVDEVAARHASIEQRVSQILWLVQDQIRYVGLEIGRGSYIPRKPDEVVASGYGDCKDKALLLATALKYLGIEAHVALASISDGKALADRLPSPYAFDHAIVRAQLGGKAYWLDPTRSHQGGVGPAMAQPDYGYALPIADGPAQLLSMAQPAPEEPTATVVEVFEIPEGEAEAIRLQATTSYKGREADRMRALIAATSRATLAKRFNDYYSDLYPGAALEGDVVVEDDRNRNRLILRESYLIDQANLSAGLPDGMWPLEASMVQKLLRTPSALHRQAPVALDPTVLRLHTIVIEGRHLNMGALDDKTIQNDYFTFALKSTVQPGIFEAEWMLRITQPFVPADEIRPYLRDASAAALATSWNYNLAALLGGGGADTPVAEPSFDLERVAALGIVAAVVGLIVFLTMATRYGLRADRDYAANGYYFPVGLVKFLVLGVTSFGLYAAFWMWKCNRWRNEFQGGVTAAFWRGIFFVLWLYPVFDQANRRNQINPLPQWLGVGAAVLSVLTWPLGIFLSLLLKGTVMRDVAEQTIIVMQVILAIPAVLAVNRLHDKANVALTRNSKFNPWNIAGIAIGILMTAMPFVLPDDDLG